MQRDGYIWCLLMGVASSPSGGIDNFILSREKSSTSYSIISLLLVGMDKLWSWTRFLSYINWLRIQQQRGRKTKCQLIVREWANIITSYNEFACMGAKKSHYYKRFGCWIFNSKSISGISNSTFIYSLRRTLEALPYTVRLIHDSPLDEKQ